LIKIYKIIDPLTRTNPLIIGLIRFDIKTAGLLPNSNQLDLTKDEITGLAKTYPTQPVYTLVKMSVARYWRWTWSTFQLICWKKNFSINFWILY